MCNKECECNGTCPNKKEEKKVSITESIIESFKDINAFEVVDALSDVMAEVSAETAEKLTDVLSRMVEAKDQMDALLNIANMRSVFLESFVDEKNNVIFESVEDGDPAACDVYVYPKFRDVYICEPDAEHATAMFGFRTNTSFSGVAIYSGEKDTLFQSARLLFQNQAALDFFVENLKKATVFDQVKPTDPVTAAAMTSVFGYRAQVEDILDYKIGDSEWNAVDVVSAVLNDDGVETGSHRFTSFLASGDIVDAVDNMFDEPVLSVRSYNNINVNEIHYTIADSVALEIDEFPVLLTAEVLAELNRLTTSAMNNRVLN